MIKQNLHTHSQFCDGQNTMEEMAQAALLCGFETLGFSSHSYTGFVSNSTQIKKQDIDSYFRKVARLKEQYKGKLKILSGMEYESTCLSGTSDIDNRCDYSIGSVHILHKGTEIYDVDCSPELFNQGCDSFGGVRNYVEAFYNEVVRFAKVSPYTITGHFDLVTKFIGFGVNDFTNQAWYKDISTSALEQVVNCGKIIEVNTGAMARLGKKDPYPSLNLIKKLADMKAILVVSSDAHSANSINYKFDEMEKILDSFGFRKVNYNSTINEVYVEQSILQC